MNKTLIHNRKILVLFLLLVTVLSSSFEFHSLDKLKKLMRKNKRDKVLVQKITQFRAGPTEKKLDLRKASRRRIVKTAKKYVGRPYCAGGTNRCMDCSGLVYACFRKYKSPIPRTAEAQARYGKIIIKKRRLKKGDLLFFIRTYRTSKLITHTGIYLKNGEFIHASSSRGVMISKLDSKYWNNKFLFATRVY